MKERKKEGRKEGRDRRGNRRKVLEMLVKEKLKVKDISNEKKIIRKTKGKYYTIKKERR